MIILLIIAIVLIIFIIYEMNMFIVLKNKLKQSKSTIEVYLNQRFDLIPNLVEVVKEYERYEAEVFEKISKMRSVYQNEEKKDLQKASKINTECNKMFAVAENMPELKANEQFLELQKAIKQTENNLQAARRLYNGDVTLYNTAIKTFPNNIIAKLFHFQEENLFEIEEYKKENISLDM